MSVPASWIRSRRVELLWGIFSLANVLVLVRLVNYETVPFHFVWVSLTLVYGYKMWRLRSTLLTLLGVCVTTGIALGWVVTQGPQGPDELTEVPLMGAVFLAMVWHAERRRAALEQVRQATAREHEFIRDASHQLKTPITIARAHAEVARDAAVPRRDDLEVIADELGRLSKVAEGLLALATTQELDSLVRTTFEPAELIDDAERRWTASAKRRWRFECEAAGTLFADRLRLESALDALIENAVEATEDGDLIALLAYADDGSAVFEVSDSGTGIPEHLLPKVFDRFWSVRDIEPHSARRTGLGLAIVKAIAEAHGGSVSVRSVVNVGSAFELRVPGYVSVDGPSQQQERRVRELAATTQPQ